MSHDLAVAGAGVLGLAHALAAARPGKRIVVIERDARCVGASVRDFGLVTVTGRHTGGCAAKARRTLDVRAEVAPTAGEPILHEGLIVTALRAEAARPAPDRWRIADAPDEATRIAAVTAGCGAPTALAIGEETVADLYGRPKEAA